MKKILLILSIILLLPLKICSNDALIKEDTAEVKVSPYWFTSGLYLPYVNILAVDIIPLSKDSAYNTYKWAIMKQNDKLDELLKDIRKERYKQTVASSIIGTTMLIWWGIILF